MQPGCKEIQSISGQVVEQGQEVLHTLAYRTPLASGRPLRSEMAHRLVESHLSCVMLASMVRAGRAMVGTIYPARDISYLLDVYSDNQLVLTIRYVANSNQRNVRVAITGYATVHTAQSDMQIPS